MNLSDVSYYNALNGCLKCLANGKFYEGYGVGFPTFNDELRTDEAFRSGIYEDYHKGKTPLTKIDGFNIIDDMPIGDELHLIDLGVTKRLLKGWIDGTLSKRLKFSVYMRNLMTEYLTSSKRPSEIHRTIRGIDQISYWKGTEFRTFLLYLSIVLLKKFLQKQHYQHFLYYFCSITICSTQYHISMLIDTAESMLKVFLDILKKLYGPEHCVSNIHNLTKA